MADSQNSDQSLGIFLAALGIVVALVIGLGQIEPGRNFACEYTGVYCKRTNKVQIYEVTHFADKTDDDTPWMSLFRAATGDFMASSNTECFDRSRLNTFLDAHKNQSNDYGMVFIGSDDKWFFSNEFLNNGKYTLFDHADLLFALNSRYTRLVRFLKYDIYTTVDSDGFHRRDYDASYKIVLPKDTGENDVVCELFFPGEGPLSFHFAFEDDVWGTDEPVDRQFTLQHPDANSK